VRVSLAVALLLVGCARESADGAQVLSQARVALVERERRLTAFHLVATTVESGQTASHEAWFRSPNRSRGELHSRPRRTVAFDGQRLFTVEHDEQRFTTFRLSLPPEKAAWVLASTFQPFVPEGFRAPLLPSRGVRASATSRPGAPRAVELSVEAGEGVTVRYTLRLPAGDFLEKRTTTGHSVEVLRVDGETCEPALAVCVPRRLVLERDGEPLGVTTLERVELNPALPESTFTLEAPPGYAREQHELAEP
jgi:outer membrane lipoprotein-sorting protein